MKLHLGCGSRIIPGWINVDLDPPADTLCDVRNGLPFIKDGTVTHIYSEHFLEHLTREEGAALLRECARVLRKHAFIRISVPSLSRLVQAYVDNDTKFAEAVGWLPATSCQMLNEGMRSWDHKFLYNEAELRLLLEECGYSRITRAKYRKTTYVDMAEESRPDLDDLIMEAVRA